MSEFRNLVEQIMANHGQPDPIQVGPKLYESWSLAGLMQRADIVEDVEIKIEHPTHGTGTVMEIDASGEKAQVQWDRLGSWTNNSEHLTLEEASRVVVLNDTKYLHDQLSEDTEMNNIDLTGDDLQALYEGDGYMSVPAPSDTILTKQSEFSSDAGEKPLSGLDGDGGATNEPHEEGGAPSDAPGTPPVASMDEPSRKAKIAKGGGGSGSNQHKKTSSKASSEEDNNEDDDMKNESFSLAEADFENIEEMDHMDEGSYMEHDMEAGEIAVTKEFLEKLVAAACAASLDSDKIAMVVDCVADCCDEDRTLDVSDIGTVMSKLKDKVSGAPAAGDEFDGPEEDADLMGAEDGVEECGEYMDEGSQEARDKGRMRRQHKQMDKQRQRGDGGNRPKYRKPKAQKDPVEEGELPDALKKHKIEKGSDADGDGKVNESVRGKRTKGRKQLDEAWLSAIPNVGNKRDAANYDGMDQDDIEIAEIKRLAQI